MVPIGAYRAAVAATLAGLTPADLEAFADSSAFKLTIPEVRARAIDELARTIDTLAVAIAGRLASVGRHADDVAIRSTAGAIVGVVIAATLPWREGVRCGDASLDFRSIFERIDEGLRCLEAGLPLGSMPPPPGGVVGGRRARSGPHRRRRCLDGRPPVARDGPALLRPAIRSGRPGPLARPQGRGRPLVEAHRQPGGSLQDLVEGAGHPHIAAVQAESGETAQDHLQ